MNEKNEPVNFEVIYQVTDRFIDTFSFLNVSRDDNEHIYLAVDDKTGDGLSYDCSYNTLKISFGKEEDMNVLYKRFCQYYTYQHYGDSSHEDCFSKSYPCYIKSPHSLPIRSSLKSMP